MKLNVLGNTGITVSELCYGALPLGPLQANLPLETGAGIIRYCLEQGVNFIDTAQAYGTYPYIRKALEGFGRPVVIASKSAAASYEEMRRAIDEARTALEHDVIDIFLLHAARVTPDVFVERKEALRCLCEAKAEDRIRATGISTHAVDVVRAAADVPEIDIVFPILNLTGIGILRGSAADMESAIEYAAYKGKGVYIQKALGGGHLADRFEEAIAYAISRPNVASVAVGMLSREEVDADIAAVEGRAVPESARARLSKANKRLVVQTQFCKGCRSCERVCPSSAIRVVDGKAVVDHRICVLCGYCNPVCPQFALRLV